MKNCFLDDLSFNLHCFLDNCIQIFDEVPLLGLLQEKIMDISCLLNSHPTSLVYLSFSLRIILRQILTLYFCFYSKFKIFISIFFVSKLFSRGRLKIFCFLLVELF